MTQGWAAATFMAHQVVARDADGADDAFLFQLGELVADAFILGGPLVVHHAMDQAHVDPFHVEFLQVAMHFFFGAAGGRVPVFFAWPELGQQGELVAGNAFDHVFHEGLRAVAVGHVDEVHALVEAAAEHAVEDLFARPRQFGGMVEAVESGALGQARHFDAGLPQGNDFRAAEAAGGRFGRRQQPGSRHQEPGTKADVFRN